MRTTLFLALGFLSAGSSVASDILVGPGSSIQAAIVAAVDGDRILIAPGTYVEQIDLLGKAIELIGTGGPTATVIDANHAGVALRMVNGEGAGTVLRSLTVTGGSGGLGPGGVVTNGTPLLEDCVVRNNAGRLGGGVHGDATMIRCRIENNSSSLNHGGGVYGAPTMVDCLVRGNRCTGARGAGVYLTGGTASLVGCAIVGNSAILSGGRGGGIAVHSSATVTIDRCVIADNFAWGSLAGAYAGGIWGSAVLVDCIVYGNDATQMEGGATATYSLVQGGAPGTGNIDESPMFWDEATFDVHPMAGSPCIDSADPTSPLDADGSRGDMGAFAFDPNYLPGPVVECTAVANSTGQGASMGYSGSWSLAANDLVLETQSCPANSFGIYFMGADPLMQAVPQGFLCINGPLTRLPASQATPAGLMQLPFDHLGLPAGAPVLLTGSTWRFQLWYRDFGSTSLFSDALAVTFVD